MKLKLFLLSILLVSIILVQPFRIVRAAQVRSEGCKTINDIGGPKKLTLGEKKIFDDRTTIMEIRGLPFNKGEVIKFKWEVLDWGGNRLASKGAFVGNPVTGPKDANDKGEGSLNEEITVDGKRTFNIEVEMSQEVREAAWAIRYWLRCSPSDRRAELPTATDDATVVVSLTPPPTATAEATLTDQPTIEPTSVPTELTSEPTIVATSTDLPTPTSPTQLPPATQHTAQPVPSSQP
jgi:hypothetical protein